MSSTAFGHVATCQPPHVCGGQAGAAGPGLRQPSGTAEDKMHRNVSRPSVSARTKQATGSHSHTSRLVASAAFPSEICTEQRAQVQT